MTAKNPPEETSTTVFVDELEDETAHLLLRDRSFSVPRALLPDGAREGQWLRIRVAPAAAPDDASSARDRLGNDDPGGPIKL